MEALKQILNIPEDHRLHFDVTVPANFPSGPAEVLLVFSFKDTPSSMQSAEVFKLAGSLKNSPHFGGDPLAIQKALRDEWQK